MSTMKLLLLSAGLFMAVSSAPTLFNTISKVDNTESCDEMTAPIIDLITNMIIVARGFGTDIRPKIKEMKKELKYDLTDPYDVRKFACKIVAIKSLKDLASFIGKPYPEVKMAYAKSQRTVKLQGGYRNVFQRAHIAMDILVALERFNFPKFPLKNSDEILPFFHSMAVKYRSGFLQKMKPDLPNIADLTGAAKAVAKASNLQEMATALDIKPRALLQVAAMFSHIKPYVCNYKTMLESVERIHYLSVKIGLYNLQ